MICIDVGEVLVTALMFLVGASCSLAALFIGNLAYDFWYGKG